MILDADVDGVGYDTAVPLGRAAYKAVASRDFVYKRNGVVQLTVLEACVGYVKKALSTDFAVLAEAGETFGIEIVLPKALFPGGVIEQLKLRYNLNAAGRNTFAYAQSTVYRAPVSSASQVTLLLKEDVILNGVAYQFKLAEEKTTMEEFFVYGCTGIGSAQADLQPAVAGALAVADQTKVT